MLRRSIAVVGICVALLLLAILIVFAYINLAIYDNAVVKQVLALPSSYKQLIYEPYQGPRPWETTRPADPFTYPIAQGDVGPTEHLFSGPMTYPFRCRTLDSELGQMLVDNQDGIGMAVYGEDSSGQETEEIIGYSKDCLLKTKVQYFYNRVDTDDFFPLKDAQQDITKISVDGKEIDFVVRVETGTINRFIYVIAALKGSGETLEKPATDNWNRKLIYQFRGGVGIGHTQGREKPVKLLARRYDELAKGYALAYSTGNQTSNHYNLWLAEEVAMRVKSQFTALYGAPLYTVGIGGSGGAIQQYILAQNHPGLLDAIIPLYSFPDMITQTIYAFDCELLEYYFDVTDGQNDHWNSWSARQSIEGLNTSGNVDYEYEYLRIYANILHKVRPVFPQGLSECINGWRGLAPLVNNPTFVHFSKYFTPEVLNATRWSHWSDLAFLYGTDKDGYGNRLWGNVGVQYGLQALLTGEISTEEFLNLNASIGSWKPGAAMTREQLGGRFSGKKNLFHVNIWSQQNINLSPNPRQNPALRAKANDHAIKAAFQAGLVFQGNIDIPVIDLRHYLEDELDMHHLSASFASRLRLQAGRGDAHNQLIWVAEKPYNPIPDAFELISRWMKNLRQNPKKSVAQNRPDDAQDRCYDDKGELVAEGARVWDGQWNLQPPGDCLKVYPSYTNSRIVAGGSFSGDQFKCDLKSTTAAVESGSYGGVDMSAYEHDLQKIFPLGVCNYQQKVLPQSLSSGSH